MYLLLCENYNIASHEVIFAGFTGVIVLDISSKPKLYIFWNHQQSNVISMIRSLNASARNLQVHEDNGL